MKTTCLRQDVIKRSGSKVSGGIDARTEADGGPA